MLLKFNIGAGGLAEFHEPGDFFRLLSSQGAVTVRFYRQGRELVEAEDVTGGYAERFVEAFDRIMIESASAQTIQFVARMGNQVSYDTPPNGQVIVTNTAGAFVHAVHTVTSLSGQLKAANKYRRYLLIQNKNPSGDIYVKVDGQPVAVAGGVKIGPGGSWELAGYVPTGAITAIGSLANNPVVVTVEG